MTTSIQVELGPVQETLLIPLLARARETEKPRGLLHDPRALEIVRLLDYDFAKWEGGRSLAGAMLRARMFDRYVEGFLQSYPHGTVVELGCGLDTRFERLDNGKVRWFDLDLPDVIALRRRFFDDTPRRSMIAASLLDCAWMEQVEDAGGPWMFVAEAVLIYFDALDAQCAFSSLAGRFPGPASPLTPPPPKWSTPRRRTMPCGTCLAQAGFAGAATTRARSSRGARTCGCCLPRRSSTPAANYSTACR